MLPDLTQARGHAAGLPVIGETSSGNIVRQLLCEGERGLDSRLDEEFFGDVAIILKTVKVILKRDGAR